MEQIVTKYGYLGILIGTFFEGETVLILGGFFARRGYLDLPFVIAAAFTGSLAADQLFFLLGKVKGPTILRNRQAWKMKADKVFHLLKAHEVGVMFGFQFLYGFRTIAPFIIGASGINPLRFALYNILGAAIWALLLGTLGYLFGNFLELIIEDVHRNEIWIVLIISFAGLALCGRYWLNHIRMDQTAK